MSNAFSRPIAAAGSLEELAKDRHRFIDKSVLLTGDEEVLSTASGAATFVASLHLLPRICPHVTVSLPAGMTQLRDVCRQAAARIQFGREVMFRDDTTPEAFDAVLAIGIHSHRRAPMTVVNADGWTVRVASGDAELRQPSAFENPISALAAASLGTCEVFKRLIALDPSRGTIHTALAFDLLTLEVVPIDQPARHELVPTIDSEVLLGGAGAIGNGVVYAFRNLRFAQRITILDRQAYGEENLGTCVLIGPADVEKSKAETLCNELRALGIDATPYTGEMSAFLAECAQPPRKVLAGFDNIDARHEIQELWPDLLIDGALGAFTVQVGRHPWGEDVGCLKCVFRHPPGRSAEALAAELSGLAIERVMLAEQPVTQRDVDNAPPTKRAFLASHVGRRICSVIEDAVKLSTQSQRKGFAPSVPFVATMTAAMMVTELVREASSTSPLAPAFQLDMLQGPQRGMLVSQGRRRDCKCVERRSVIEAYRGQRSE